MTDAARTPIDITFILNHDPSDKSIQVPNLYRHAVMTAMTEALNAVGLENYELITQTDPNFHEDMLRLKLPEAWLHDTGGNSMLAPFENYYIVNFNNGSRIIFILLPPQYNDLQPDPMIQ